MCRTYNRIGSLTTIKQQLVKNNIHDFKSLRDILDFQRSYIISRKQLIARHETLIEQEKQMLNSEIQKLKIAIETQKQQSEQKLKDEINNLKQVLRNSLDYRPKNLFQKFSQGLKHRGYRKKIKRKEENFDTEIYLSLATLIYDCQIKSDRYQFITSHHNEAIRHSAQYVLSELDRKKEIIDGLNSFIYGAMGEQKVVKTLEHLSDDYFLINDFAVSFSPAIYNRQENEYINSIQIDHILVGPSGIFLIETKNWSEKSLQNLSLRSPVQQIKRTSFVLFKLLNNEMNNHRLRLERHHWGSKKISIKNLIVLTTTKPKEEFQHVKILTTNELLSYINYFKPLFSNAETEKIASFLVEINDQKIVYNLK